MFKLIQADPPAGQVRQVTFVPFLPDGRCVLIERAEGPGLPAGEVLAGEDYLIDTVLNLSSSPAPITPTVSGPPASWAGPRVVTAASRARRPNSAECPRPCCY